MRSKAEQAFYKQRSFRQTELEPFCNGYVAGQTEMGDHLKRLHKAAQAVLNCRDSRDEGYYLAKLEEVLNEL